MAGNGTQSSELGELQRRLVLIKVGVLLIMGLLVVRLWQLQVHEGPYWRDRARDNRTRSIVLEPARGLIYDRNGLLLANNIPSFNLYVSLEDVKDRDQLLRTLEQWVDVDVPELSEKLARYGQWARVKLKGGLSLKEAALIESHRLDLPGVVIQPESQRNYLLSPYAAHLMGYVGEVSEDQLTQAEFRGLRPGSTVGQYGVERTYDSFLRGKAGRKLVEVDARGHEKQIISVTKPQAGDDLYLTIDFRLQKLAEELLNENNGAIVALDPTNGQILVLASGPSFDPNALSRGLSARQWQNFLRDSRHPLTNRAIQGLYPPGSTFKVVMAAATLETEAVNLKTKVNCLGGFRFGGRMYRDWKAGGHGSVNIAKALIHSCDVFFYKFGHRMGVETIASYAREFGLGQKTGIDLPSERAGIVPSHAWKQQVKGEPWYPGETLSVSIGQGYVTVTPIQMARLIATVANNGVAFQPRLVKVMKDRKTGQLQEWPAIPDGQVGVQLANLAHIQQALAEVVTQGTARRAKSSLVSIAGKTGTSQVVNRQLVEEKKEIPKAFRDHAWFVSYAPVDHPRIAVAVLLEHMGHGGEAAAPVARKIIEAFARLAASESEGTQDIREGNHVSFVRTGKQGHG